MRRSNSVHNSVHNPVAGDEPQSQSQSQPKPQPLNKRLSLRRSDSLARSGSRRSMQASSVRSLNVHSAPDNEPKELQSAFYCPVPTTGSPTDVLVNRFQAWRKLLKDLIAYFREVQSAHEQRAKSFTKLSSVAGSIPNPPAFLRSEGIDDALVFIRNYNRSATMEAQRAKELEEDVILALTGLRSDLQQKIKEIKHLSSDFKNSIDKEMENTAKHIRALSSVLEKSDTDVLHANGKQDPYLLRLAVDRQIERQLDEENYLHQAYLNLEGSGRELESIVVGEIQKAYGAYVGIIKREADIANELAGELTDGPLSMPRDREWTHFVLNDHRVLDPSIPMRSFNQIRYPGQDHYAATEIRCGLLERKSKYLKSYTAGWYVLSTTHLHEFKSVDKAQAPVMSLYLPEQRLGSHSNAGGSSNKFILKGRQTGAMHRGHTWVFRAESYNTMMAWFEDIKALTEKSPEERTDFVIAHSRQSISRESRQSNSSDGFGEEEDEEPFRANQGNVHLAPRPELVSRRSQPGGRFPSDLQVNAQRGFPETRTSSDGSSQDFTVDAQTVALATAMPGSVTGAYANGANIHHGSEGQDTLQYGSNGQALMQDMHSQAAIAGRQARLDSVNPYTSESVPILRTESPGNAAGGGDQIDFRAPFTASQAHGQVGKDDESVTQRGSSNPNGNVMNPAGAPYDTLSKASFDLASRGDLEGLQVVTNRERFPGGFPTESSKRAAGDGTNSNATSVKLPMPGGFPDASGGMV